MTIRIQTRANGFCRAIVEGSMTIYEAAADKPVLLDALAKAELTEIDLSSVREMDTAGLQILILAKRESIKAGRVLRLVGSNPVLRDILERYGLVAYFGLVADPVAVASSSKKRRRRPAETRRS